MTAKKKKPGPRAAVTKNRRVKAATVPSDLVTRRVILRRDRWEKVEAMTRALSTQRGVLAAPAEVFAIVIDAGLEGFNPDGTARPISPSRFLVAGVNASMEASAESHRKIDDLQAEVRRHEQALAEKTSELEAATKARDLRDEALATWEARNREVASKVHAVTAERDAARADLADVEGQRDRAIEAHAKCVGSVDHDQCSTSFTDGRDEDACALCRAEAEVDSLTSEKERLEKEAEVLEDRPTREDLDASEKEVESLEKKLEEAENGRSAAENELTETKESFAASVPDLGSVAVYLFGLGATFDEIYALVTTDEGRAEVQKAWASAVPQMPGACFEFKGGAL